MSYEEGHGALRHLKGYFDSLSFVSPLLSLLRFPHSLTDAHPLNLSVGIYSGTFLASSFEATVMNSATATAAVARLLRIVFPDTDSPNEHSASEHTLF